MDKPDPDSTPTGAQRRQPARVLAAWIAQLIEDARGAQIPRFRNLARQLQSEALAWDNASLTRSVAAMLDAARTLDCESLRRRSLLARLTGGAERIAGRFRQSYSAVVGASVEVRRRNDDVAASYRTHAARARRILVELEMEYLHLDREIEQAVLWLGEISQEMVESQPAPGAAQDPRLLSFASRMEACTRELKQLQSASDAGRDICVAGQNVLARRTALLDMVRIHLDGFEKVWVRRVGNVAADLMNPLAPVPGLQKAQEAHGELVKRLELTGQANLDLQGEEQAMAHRLQEFHRQLDAFE